MMLSMPTELTVTAETADTRRVVGTLLTWDTPGRTSMGIVTVRRGALALPVPAGRLRLLYGHDRENPIGVCIRHDDTTDGLVAEFLIARTAQGDRYLAELDPAAPIRDGLSVEIDDVEFDGSAVISGVLTAVAAVPLPAFTDSRAQLAAQLGEDAMTDSLDAAPVAAEAAPEPAPMVPDGPLTAGRAGTWPPVAPRIRTAPVSPVRLMAEQLTGARMTGNAGPMLAAALADVTPAGNGTGNESAGLMVQALGELWAGVEYSPVYRPLILAGALTGVEVSAWRWSVPPTVADYAGNKGAVPSNAATLAKVTVTPTRIAGAHDIDRIYHDLGDAQVLESYWRQMTESVAVELDARALAIILAAAGALDASPASAMEAIVRGTIAVSKVAPASYALVADDVAEDLALTPASDAPIGAPFALPPVILGSGLAPGTVIVGARQGCRQLTFEPPVRAEVVNIPNGGIDAGLFSYSAELVENSAAVVGYTVTPPVLP